MSIILGKFLCNSSSYACFFRWSIKNGITFCFTMQNAHFLLLKKLILNPKLTIARIKRRAELVFRLQYAKWLLGGMIFKHKSFFYSQYKTPTLCFVCVCVCVLKINSIKKIISLNSTVHSVFPHHSMSWYFTVLLFMLFLELVTMRYVTLDYMGCLCSSMYVPKACNSVFLSCNTTHPKFGMRLYFYVPYFCDVYVYYIILYHIAVTFFH